VAWSPHGDHPRRLEEEVQPGRCWRAYTAERRDGARRSSVCRRPRRKIKVLVIEGESGGTKGGREVVWAAAAWSTGRFRGGANGQRRRRLCSAWGRLRRREKTAMRTRKTSADLFLSPSLYTARHVGAGACGRRGWRVHGSARGKVRHVHVPGYGARPNNRAETLRPRESTATDARHLYAGEPRGRHVDGRHGRHTRAGDVLGAATPACTPSFISWVYFRKCKTHKSGN
jgi:hypothetical protein